MEERTCQDWLDGKFGLNSSDIFFPNLKGENINIPEDMPEVYKRELRKKIVKREEENFKNLINDKELLPEVLDCINAEKEKIFNAAVQNKTNELTNHYLSSKKNEKYLQDEIHDVKVILGIREKELMDDIEKGLLLNRSRLDFVDLSDIREYYLTVLKPNKPAQVGFINSPKFPFQDISKVPFRIMATAFFEYLKWLEGFNFKEYKKIQANQNNKEFKSPHIAIALFAIGQNITKEGADYWLNKYSENKIVKGLIRKEIKTKNFIISEKKDFRSYKIQLNNLIKAKELLQLEGLTHGVNKVDEFITALDIHNQRFSTKKIPVLKP